MKNCLLRSFQAILVFSLAFTLTNCGNLDNPLEELSGGGSGGGSSTTENKYYVWDDTQLKLVATDIPSDAKEVTASTEKLEGGTYIVKGDVTISRAEGLDVTADTKLILCDGAKLTVNGHIEDESGSNTLKISIYGQEKQTGKLIIDATDSHGLWAKDIEIHGGDIDVKAVTGGFIPNGIYTYNDLAIYGGTVKATGGDATTTLSGGCGIFCGVTEGNLTIKGDAVVKAYGGAKDAMTGGTGIWVNGTGTKGNIEISGNADVYASSDGSGYTINAENNISLSAKKIETLGGLYDNGIESNKGDVIISAGEVKVVAGTNGIGIETIIGDVSITGGTVEIIGCNNRAIKSANDVVITTDITSLKLTHVGVTSDALIDWVTIGLSGNVKVGSSTFASGIWSGATLTDGYNSTVGGIKITRNGDVITLVKDE